MGQAGLTLATLWVLQAQAWPQYGLLQEKSNEREHNITESEREDDNIGAEIDIADRRHFNIDLDFNLSCVNISCLKQPSFCVQAK